MLLLSRTVFSARSAVIIRFCLRPSSLWPLPSTWEWNWVCCFLGTSKLKSRKTGEKKKKKKFGHILLINRDRLAHLHIKHTMLICRKRNLFTFQPFCVCAFYHSGTFWACFLLFCIVMSTWLSGLQIVNLLQNSFWELMRKVLNPKWISRRRRNLHVELMPPRLRLACFAGQQTQRT